MKIVIDFDGTCVNHVFPDVGEDVPDAVEVIKKLVNKKHQIMLYTMRSGNFLSVAVQWFIDRGIPLSGINYDPAQTSWTISPKCYAEMYIDDAALGCPLKSVEGWERLCVDWLKVADMLQELKVL